MTKRLILAALIAVASLTTTTETGAALADRTRPPCISHSWIPRTMGLVEHDLRLDALVDCAVARWWPGHADTVTAIFDRESGGNPFAMNPEVPGACVADVPSTSADETSYGSCGLGQHLIRYWLGRVHAYLSPAWFKAWPARWWNARANTIVTVRMMAAQGGVCPAWC